VAFRKVPLLLQLLLCTKDNFLTQLQACDVSLLMRAG